MTDVEMAAGLCAIAYLDPAGQRAAMQEVGWLDNEPFDRSGVQGFAARDANGWWLVFRGSDEPVDWVRNLKFGQVDHLAGMVHGGFWAAYAKVREIVRHLFPPGELVRIAGHSLGGALAVLAAVDLRDTRTVVSVTTLGQPRVGNLALLRGQSPSESHPDNLRGIPFNRITNGNDIVPRLLWWHPGYRHAGKHLHLRNDGAAGRATVIDTVRGMWSAWGHHRVDSLDDHAIARYVAAIGREMSGEMSG